MTPIKIKLAKPKLFLNSPVFIEPIPINITQAKDNIKATGFSLIAVAIALPLSSDATPQWAQTPGLAFIFSPQALQNIIYPREFKFLFSVGRFAQGKSGQLAGERPAWAGTHGAALLCWNNDLDPPSSSPSTNRSYHRGASPARRSSRCKRVSVYFRHLGQFRQLAISWQESNSRMDPAYALAAYRRVKPRRSRRVAGAGLPQLPLPRQPPGSRPPRPVLQ